MELNGDDGFDLSEYAGLIGDKEENDSVGRPSIKPAHTLQLVLPEGTHGAYYSTLHGWPYLNGAATLIKLLALAEKYNGEGWDVAKFEITIEGNRLRSVFDQICETKRFSLKISGPTDGKKPEVLNIAVVELKD